MYLFKNRLIVFFFFLTTWLLFILFVFSREEHDLPWWNVAILLTSCVGFMIGYYSSQNDRGINEHSQGTFVARHQVYEYMVLQLKLRVARREIGFIDYWKYRIFKYRGWYELNKADLLKDLNCVSWEEIKKEYTRGAKE